MISLSSPQEILDGVVRMPLSKSICNRLLVIGALRREPFFFDKEVLSDDTRNLQEIVDKLSNDKERKGLYNVGAAGTNMRFLTALLSHRQGDYVLTGGERMCKRPIKPLVDALRRLGAQIEYLEADGYPPLHIKGSPLHGGTVEIDATVSSQFISALMLIAPDFAEGIRILFSGIPVSSPYIYLTAEVMRRCGAKVDIFFNEIVVHANHPYRPSGSIEVEGDWSSASYWYAFLAMFPCGQIFLQGLQQHSAQGDAVIANLMEPFGVKTTYHSDGLLLQKEKHIQPQFFEHDFSLAPDIAQTFMALLSAKNIKSHLTGLQTLKNKESHRIEAMAMELKKVGVEMDCSGDQVFIPECNATHISHRPFDSHSDHRVVMSMALWSVPLGKVLMNNPEVVSKSYPAFWKDLQRVGFLIS